MRLLKALSAFLCAAFCLASFPAFSFAPYDSYTYDAWGTPVESPMPYVYAAAISGASLGIGEFASVTDVESSGDEVFIADGGNNRIVVLNRDFKLARVIESFQNGGEPDRFANPQGLFATREHLYIADTDNERIIKLRFDGTLVREYKRPETSLLEANFPFKPRKIAVDVSERMYVILASVNQGLMEMDAQGKFMGFFGANRVRMNFAEYIWRFFMSEEQRANRVLNLPTEYTNLALDEKGFIFSVTAAAVQNQTVKSEPPVKRLNPRGDDVLRKRGVVPPVGDYMIASDAILSTLVDVSVSDSGIYTVLDQNQSRLFSYDYDGNLLFTFGGKGKTAANIQMAGALTAFGRNFLVTDTLQKNVVVYKMTEYGILIENAVSLEKKGRFAEAQTEWSLVLNQNANLESAYIGIGKAAYSSGDYKTAMRYFDSAQNREYYNKAFKAQRKQMMSAIMPYAGIAVIVLICVLILLANRKRITAYCRRLLIDEELS